MKCVTAARLAALALPVLLVVAAAPLSAAEPAGIEATAAWARATGGMTQSGAAYLTLINRGPADDRLVAVSTPAAKVAQLHEMRTDSHNVMHMRRVRELDVPAGKTVSLAPGGYHVMLMRLAAPLKQGGTFPLTLRFAKAGEKTVEVTVMPMGSPGPSGAGHMGHMGESGSMSGMGAPQQR